MSQHRATGRTSVVGRPSWRLLSVLVVVLVTAGTTWFSGASFTSSTFTWATVGAAADYHPPQVSVTSPGATVSGTVQVRATASDSASGVARVRIEYAAAGSSAWTVLCTDQTSPYSCSWDTAQLPAGDYRLRATATDNVGSSATSEVVRTTVLGAATVTLTAVPAFVTGTVGLSATVTDAGGLGVSSTFQVRTPSGSWVDVAGCAARTGTSPACSWTTGASGPVDVRVVSTVGSGAGARTVTDSQQGVVVDNTAPTVTVSAPQPMSGTTQVVAETADAHSGVAEVEISIRARSFFGTGSWSSVCTVTAAPWRCDLDTDSLSSSFLVSYDLRAVAVDRVGLSTTSDVVNRSVSRASVVITAPADGTRVRGTTSITVDADTAGSTLREVVVEQRRAGGDWTVVCQGSTSTTCAWMTDGLTNATHELRASITYGGGFFGTSTVSSRVVAVVVDNPAPRALDVQATSNSTNGRPSTNDVLELTYEGAIDLTSIRAGWNGSSTSVSVTFADRAVAPATGGDRVTFANADLGTVVFGQDYVLAGRSVTASATMTATTALVDGTTRTIVTIRLGSVATADLSPAATGNVNGTMVWTPRSEVRSLNGTPVTGTAATESGASDRDL